MSDLTEVERLRLVVEEYGKLAQTAQHWRDLFAPISDSNRARFAPQELRLIEAVDRAGTMFLCWADGRLVGVQLPGEESVR